MNVRGVAPLPRVRSILFVCLGNICRSPLAQGVLEHHAQTRAVRGKLTIESCGTGGWHVGSPPDPRTVRVAAAHGVTLRSLARQLDPDRDFSRFDLILAMDRANLRDVLRAGCPAERASLFLSHAPATVGTPHNFEVPDPYYGEHDGFETVFRLVDAGATALLDGMFPRN